MLHQLQLPGLDAPAVEPLPHTDVLLDGTQGSFK